MIDLTQPRTKFAEKNDQDVVADLLDHCVLRSTDDVLAHGTSACTSRAARIIAIGQAG